MIDTPKIKTNRDTMNVAMVQMIWGRKAALKYSDEKMCGLLGCSKFNLYRIRDCPADYLSEVLLLCWRMGIPLEEFKSKIIYP